MLNLTRTLLPQGDRHPGSDIKLALPMLLLSRVVILNWLGRPTKTAMLNQLAVMHAAASVVSKGCVC
jgi:hypothetical protein